MVNGSFTVASSKGEGLFMLCTRNSKNAQISMMGCKCRTIVRLIQETQRRQEDKETQRRQEEEEEEEMFFI